MKRVLITGATGFVGRNLIPTLAKSHDLQLATVNRNPQKAAEIFANIDCKHLNANELNVAAEFDPNIVIHLAALVTSQNNSQILRELLETNVVFGVTLLDSLKNCTNLELFVNVGSFAEYRLGAEHVTNAYLYSTTKSAFKPFLEYYSNLAGFKYLHLVPYTIYGGTDSQKKIVDFLLDSVNAITPVKMTKGEQILDFIHVKDVISFFEYIVNNVNKFTNLPNGENIFLGTGKGVTIREVAQLIEQISNKKLNVDWGGLPYRNNDVMHAVAPIGKLIQLGWRPKISLKQGLLDIIR
jgi:CDP-paratose synthetase